GDEPEPAGRRTRGEPAEPRAGTPDRRGRRRRRDADLDGERPLGRAPSPVAGRSLVLSESPRKTNDNTNKRPDPGSQPQDPIVCLCSNTRHYKFRTLTLSWYFSNKRHRPEGQRSRYFL